MFPLQLVWQLFFSFTFESKMKRHSIWYSTPIQDMGHIESERVDKCCQGSIFITLATLLQLQFLASLLLEMPLVQEKKNK